MITVKDAYSECRKALAGAQIEAADFEALCLFEKVTGYGRLGIISNGNDELIEEKYSKLFEFVKRRAEHEPLQYILGSWSFCGFDFYVGEGVLIPRDDTEVLVNLCVDFLKNKPSRITVDLCAGSGAISVALARLCGAQVTAVELSGDAYTFLEKNIKSNKTDVKALKADVFKCFADFEDKSCDLIVSNPPYIKTGELSSLQKEVLREPKMALDGGESGYEFYEAIIKNWSAKLKVGGALAFELGEEQSDYVAKLMKAQGFENIVTSADLGGTQRAIIGTIKSE